MTSHEMRTPATIATGYAEALLAQETDATRRGDLEVIGEELQRLVRASDRITRTIRMDDPDHSGGRDLAGLLRGTVERWRVLADRDWRVECAVREHACSPERLRAAIDTMVENAVRYTGPGDTVRAFAQVDGTHLVVGVADSGPGMPAMLLRGLAEGQGAVTTAQDAAYLTADPKSQTGLGLALVREVAQGCGGRLVAGTSGEGGALVAVSLPHPHRASARGGSNPAQAGGSTRP